MALLGRLLLREDRDFHTIQTVEAGFRQFEQRRGTPSGLHMLVAVARYLARTRRRCGPRIRRGGSSSGYSPPANRAGEQVRKGVPANSTPEAF